MTAAETKVTSALVVGAGTMGTGIAYVLAGAGVDVAYTDDAPVLARAATTLQDLARRAVTRGKMEPTDAEALLARCRPVERPSAAGPLDLVVEAVPEDIGLKRRILAELEQLRPAVLATNTSSLGIADLAEVLSSPERFIGMHFFNPVWAMPLVEIVVGPATAESTRAAAVAVAVAAGKQAIVVRDSPGFATSRLGVVLGLEAIRMLEEGVADAATIDQAMELGYGHPTGPLRLTDLVGLDVRLAIARRLAVELGSRFTPPQLLVDKVAAGELGRKAGRGFYGWGGPDHAPTR